MFALLVPSCYDKSKTSCYLTSLQGWGGKSFATSCSELPTRLIQTVRNKLILVVNYCYFKPWVWVNYHFALTSDTASCEDEQHSVRWHVFFMWLMHMCWIICHFCHRMQRSFKVLLYIFINVRALSSLRIFWKRIIISFNEACLVICAFVMSHVS
jgi:hypothetical protein